MSALSAAGKQTITIPAGGTVHANLFYPPDQIACMR